MAEEYFKVRKGLAVGDNVTVDAATGNLVTPGDIAVNGGDITTTSTTANVVNANATTVNFAGAATTLEIGAATGTTNINNNLEVDGDVTIDGGDLVVSTSTFNLANTTATTLNIGGGATTAVVIGNSAGEIDTPSDIQITGNKSIRQGDGPYSGSTDILRNNGGSAIEGILISNNNMTTSDSAMVVRTYGNQVAASTVAFTSAGKLYLQGSRGTSASPTAINNNTGIGIISFNSNLGTTAGSGTGNGFSTDLSPALFQPGSIYSFANQNHRQTLQATFTGEIDVNGILTVTAVTSGTITPGHEVRGTGFDANNGAYTITQQLTSTAPSNALGSTGTYELYYPPGVIASSTMNTYSITPGAALRFQHAAQNVPMNQFSFQSLTFQTSSGGFLNAPYTRIIGGQSWPYHPRGSRIITEITGGNTLNIGTHGFTTAGASFKIITAGNPNGLTTGTTYFVDTIPSTTTITLRTVSDGGGAVTGLTNGSGLFIIADAAAIAANGNQTQPSSVEVSGIRSAHNFAGTYWRDNARKNDWLGEFRFTGAFDTGATNTNTKIFGRATQDWASGSAIGSEIGFQTTKNSTTTTYISTIGANGSTFVNDSFTMNNTSGGSMLTIDSSGNVVATGDLRVNGNDILASDGNTNITLNSNTLTTFAGDLRVNGNDIQNSNGTTAITMSTGTPPNVIFAGDIRINGNDINASDGNTNITLNSNTLTTFAGDVQVNGNDILNSAGTTAITMSAGSPPNVIFAGDIRINGNDINASDGNTNITLNSNTLTTFAGDIRVNGGDIQNPGGTNAITLTSANATTTVRGDTLQLRNNAGNDYLVIDANKALFSKPVRTTVTTATVAKGGTYTPAATAQNSIVLEITSGSGTTSIDVDNLTVAGENGVYDILVYNNTGGSLNANDIEIINGVGNIVLQHNSSISNGERALFEINCIDIYAGATFMDTAV